MHVTSAPLTQSHLTAPYKMSPRVLWDTRVAVSLGLLLLHLGARRIPLNILRPNPKAALPLKTALLILGN